MLNHKIIQNKLNTNVSLAKRLDFIYNEIANRMAERLDYIKLIPNNVLDLGSGLGIDSSKLRNRYAKASIYQLDFAINMLKQQQDKSGLLSKIFYKNKDLVCANSNHLPFQSQSMDIVWSNLMLPFLDDYENTFKEINRVLKLGGFFLISGFGVDSLLELRELGLRTFNFPDMHIIGDKLVKQGFSNPVTDLEYITIEYTDFDSLIKDIKVIGAGGAIDIKSTLNYDRYLALKDNFNAKTKNGKFGLTLEIFYAHAWKEKVTLDLPDNQQIISFRPKKST